MSSILLITESPAKAKKIQTYLSNDYVVSSSCGHIRDLEKKKTKKYGDPNDFGIDVQNNFKPKYVILHDKKEIVKTLRKLSNNHKVIFAADDDREGEAIAWHTAKVLNTKISENNRILFREISKKAILESLKKPQKINMNEVNSQQARRIIDRLIGFRLSPCLWKHIQTDIYGLSAGRVQSALLNLVMEREDMIDSYEPEISLSIHGYFNKLGKCEYIITDQNEEDFDIPYIQRIFTILHKHRTMNVFKKNVSTEKTYPEKPFITSSLQRTSKKLLGLSVKKTMEIAQRLYESGHITYMRTDSTFISKEFQSKIQEKVIQEYGSEYFNIPHQKKVKGAQEAHEAIRITNIQKPDLDGIEKRLYDLIYERTITSHMKPAIYDVNTIHLQNEAINEYGYFIHRVRSLRFLGFKIVKNNEEISDENISIDLGDQFKIIYCESIEKPDNYPQYYDEGSMVDLLEKTGIGRPSTYSNIISTLDNRNYTTVSDIQEKEKEVMKIKVDEDGLISEEQLIAKGNLMKNKIRITSLGKKVLDYLRKNFMNIINKDFTINIEIDLDKIANGTIDHINIIRKVYDSFNSIVERQLKNGTKNLKYLGEKKGRELYFGEGPYGPYLQVRMNDQMKNISLSRYFKENNITKEMFSIHEATLLLKK